MRLIFYEMINFTHHRYTKDFRKPRTNPARLLDRMLLILGFSMFFISIFELGFLPNLEMNTQLHTFYYVGLLVYFISLTFKIPFILFKSKHSYTLMLKILTFIFLTFYFFVINFISDAIKAEYPIIRFFDNVSFTYILISLVFFIELSKNFIFLYNFNVSPYVIFIFSFIVLILLGAGFLMFPNSTNTHLTFVDALFTSTSAVCVTGLAINDTAVAFTLLGKSVILILIQIGGLGVMTFTSFIVFFFRDTSSFRNNIMLKDIVNAERLSDVFRTSLKIVFYTLLLELTGVILIYVSINSDSVTAGEGGNFYFSVFHSVSAFCNAGFSTVTDGLYHPNLRFNYFLHTIIAFLIILGGIGFPVILNIHTYVKTQVVNLFRKLSLHVRFDHVPRLIYVNTKMALLITGVLLVFGTVMFFITEYHNLLLPHDSFWKKVLVSFFNSVTPRTAGFNNLDMSKMLNPTLLVMLLLMWIGASPASTGGGIKTTTFGVAILDIGSLTRGKDRLEIFRRKISNSTVRQAFAIVMLSLFSIGFGVFLITIFESGNPAVSFEKIVFECFSAFGTVGLSMGLTPILTAQSKIVLILLMFFGRVGTLVIIMSMFRKIKSLHYMYPKESIFVG